MHVGALHSDALLLRLAQEMEMDEETARQLAGTGPVSMTLISILRPYHK